MVSPALLFPLILASLPSLSLAVSQTGVRKRNANEGPHFLQEPSGHVDLTNSTGARISCMAAGRPSPEITWALADGTSAMDLTGLRLALPDGTLVFPPFRPEEFRQDVHVAVYRCSAANVVGTVVSRDVHVKAALTHTYDVQVQDSYVIRGNNTAIFKCHVPTALSTYLKVTGWLRDGAIRLDTNSLDGKYLMVPSNGDLFIRQVGYHDAGSTYRCQTHHRLSKEVRLSTSAGRLFVTDPESNVPPRILDPLATLQVKAGEKVILPCPAQGYPPPALTWYIKDVMGHLIPVPSSGRHSFHREVLVIRDAQTADSAMYVCVASNIIGAAKAETQLTVAAPLHVHFQPRLNIISLSKPTTLHCLIAGSPVTSVSWLKNGQPLPTDRISHVSRDVIKIARTDTGDVGMYQCIVRNDFESAQATTELRLGEVFPEIHHSFDELIAQAGQSVSAQCIASGSPAPKILWTLDGMALSSDGGPRNIQDTLNSEGDTVSTLTLSSARVEDGGLFSCAAVNRLGRVQHQARLNIYGPLTVRSIPKQTLIAGEDAVLNCPFYGYPVHTIVWMRGGETLPADLRQQVLKNGTLKLRQVQRSADSGKYTCIVGSQQGSSARGEIDVDILIPVKILPFSFQENLLSEGMRARVQCVVAEGDSPITLKWVKDNQPISPQLGVATRLLDEFSTMLTISSVTPLHNGNYTCIAGNSVSQASHTANLHINVPPKWTIIPKNVSVFAGQTASFHCQAQGSPPPSIKWFRAEGASRSDQEPVHTNHEYQVFHNGTLYMSTARTQDRGFYFCKASNGVGVGLSKLVHLTVHVPPVSEYKERNLTGRVDDPLILQCAVIGEKPLKFTWKIDGQILDVKKSRYKIHQFDLQNKVVTELAISKVIKEDATAYSCISQNDFGRDESHFYVTVQEPPSNPYNLTIGEIGNRTVLATWKEPYAGNSPIINYLIQYKEVSEGTNVSDNIKNSTVNGFYTSMHISGLKPSTKYEFRISAQNDLGWSKPGKLVFITMGDEAPSAAPQFVKVDQVDERTLKVSWQPPRPEFWNGNIRGYFVGYKIVGTREDFLYKLLEVPEDYKETLSYLLTDLKKYTQYSIVVQAMNSGGRSPISTQVLAMTSEGVPSKPPLDVRCSVLTSQSIHITWQPPPTHSMNGILRGFKVLYRPNEEWYESSQLQFVTVAIPKATLQSLFKFTNYTIVVLTFTKKGDGVKSDPVYCRTLEDVPPAPGDIKALPISAQAVLISWISPARPNGIITKYNIYVRLADGNNQSQDQAVRTVQGNVTNYEVIGLKKNSKYEFWVTVFTTVGEGPKSKVISQTTKENSVKARIASFSQIIRTITKQDVKLPCLAVGIPLPDRKWILRGHVLPNTSRHRVLTDGALLLTDIQKDDSGNYTCNVNNGYNEDSITHHILVLSQPTTPVIEVLLTTATTIDLHWKSVEDGGSPIAKYILHYRQESGVWEKVEVEPKEDSHQLKNLRCGSEYHIYLIAQNKIGPSEPSSTLALKTKGSVPEMPMKDKLLEESSNSVTVRLDAWQNSICAIQHFVIQYRIHSKNVWTMAGENVKPEQKTAVIRDLQSAMRYQIRITAHNPAGSTRAEYDVATLTAAGVTIQPDVPRPEQRPVILSFMDKRVLVPASFSLLVVVVLLIISCVCMRAIHKAREKKSSKIFIIGYRDDPEPYATVHLSDLQSSLRGSTRSRKTNQVHGRAKHTKPVFEQALRIATGSTGSSNILRREDRHNPTAPPFSDSYRATSAYNLESSRPLLSKRGIKQSTSPLHRTSGHDISREETTFVFPDSGHGVQQGQPYNQSGSHHPTSANSSVKRNKLFQW